MNETAGSLSTSLTIPSSSVLQSSILSSTTSRTSMLSSHTATQISSSPAFSSSVTTSSTLSTSTSPVDPLPTSLNPDKNPLTSSALASLAKSFPTYLAVGGSILGILILVGIASWYIRRRRRINRFGLDDEEDLEEGWKVLRSRRSESRAAADRRSEGLGGDGDEKEKVRWKGVLEGGGGDAEKSGMDYEVESKRTPEVGPLPKPNERTQKQNNDKYSNDEMTMAMPITESPNLDHSITEIESPTDSPISSPMSSRRGSQEHLVRK